MRCLPPTRPSVCATPLRGLRLRALFAASSVPMKKMAKSGAAQSTELIEREGKEWTASPSGERAGVASSGILDGSFVAEWTTKRDTPSRLDAIRMLRSRPSAGDLGPIDARLAVVEALRSNQPEPAR